MIDQAKDSMRPVGNRLKHGVLGGDPTGAPRCGARTRAGTPCQGPAVHGRCRCRLHGGLSTGPRTAEGRERCRAARWKHGGRSVEAIGTARHVAALLREAKVLLAPKERAVG